jgi:hypothetical protein
MLIQTADYIDVKQRAMELGLQAPTGLTLLPRHFETAEAKSDLVYESSAADIRALWRAEHLVETRIDSEGASIPYVQEKKYEWIFPTIVVGAAIWSKDPHVVGFAIAVVANYATDYVLKGRPAWSRSDDITFDVIVERLKEVSYIKIHYEGPIADLNKLIKKIAQVAHDEREE